MDRGQRLAVQASRLSPRGRRIGGYWGWLRDLDRIGLRGWGVGSADLRLGPWAGDGWEEAAKSNFDWTSHFPERLAGPSVGLFSLGPQTLNTLD